MSKLLQRIQRKEIPRSDLLKIRENAKSLLQKGNAEAAEIIDAINKIGPPKLEAMYAFLGFCPGGDIENRQDDKMLKDGIYEYNDISKVKQLEHLTDIMVGDTIILKKRQTFGKTMRIYSYGPVNEVCESRITGKPYFRVEWTTPSEFLEVPLMACNSTVNIRDVANVEKSMPEEFWDWLGGRPLPDL